MPKLRSSIVRTAFGTIVLAGSVLAAGEAVAQAQAYKQLTPQWWQWALSMPVDVNPLLDTTGENCMVGQRGSDWFLAGIAGGGTASRDCSIPEGASLFFPVVNSVAFDTPNACGQDATPIPSSVYRAGAAGFIDGVTVATATLDGVPLRDLQRVKSPVFELALPTDNLFAQPCAQVPVFAGLPAGIYSPAIDDGIYVRLQPLAVGAHTLRLHAENPDASFVLDVTYHLTVQPVVSK